MLCAGVTQILAKDFQQRFVWRERHFNRLGVERQPDVRGFSRFDWDCDQRLSLQFLVNDLAHQNTNYTRAPQMEHQLKRTYSKFNG